MPTAIERNRQTLTDLFSRRALSHAVVFDAPVPERPWADDVACSSRPVRDWLPWMLEVYERRLKSAQALGDDSVPYASVWTGTQVFACCFGAGVQIFEGSNPAASPVVHTAREADALAEPTLEAEPIARVFEAATRLRERLGPDVPISVPDIQSPFDVAALVWEKEQLFYALYDEPEAVERLVGKCHRLVKSFLQEFGRRFGPVNYCHCPYAWAPPELGIWLSEDEVGSLSPAQFERFCLPSLVDLSNHFGGLFMHCCATADHQYGGFLKIPKLRGLNRIFQTPGPRPAVEAFTPQGTVLMMAWLDEAGMKKVVDTALPQTRFLLNMPAQTVDEARRTLDRIRAW